MSVRKLDEALDLLRGIDMHSDIGAAHHYAISDATGRSNHYLCEAKRNVGLIEGDRRYEFLSRMVSAYLDLAESMALRHIPMTMEDWEIRLNGFLTLMDREVLSDAGKVSAEMAKIHAETEWEKYRIVQDRLYQSDFDRFLLLEEKSAIISKQR